MCTSNVVGDYILEVRTHNYSNPNSLLATASVVCCDESCGMPSCDNIFYYCLRSLGTSNKDGECSGGNRSHVNYDDAPLNFSQSTVLGLPNPLPLRGLTRNWTVSITSSLHTLIVCMYVCMYAGSSVFS